MRQPHRAEPMLGLGATPGKLVGADIVGIGELLDVEKLRPLLPADHRIALSIIRDIVVPEDLERFQYLGLGQAVGSGTSDVGGVRQCGDDQLVGLATKREGTGIGENLTLVDVDLQLVEMIDPVTGIVVF